MNENGDESVLPVLLDIHLVTHMPYAEQVWQDGRLSRLTSQLMEVVEQTVRDLGEDCEGCGVSGYSFKASRAPTKAGRCALCGVWVWAQNRPDIIQGLAVGAEHRGIYYCWDHLPEDSKWRQRMERAALEAQTNCHMG